MKTSALYNILSYISAVSVLFPIAICIVRNKLLNRTLWILFLYLVISLFTEAAGFYFMYHYEENYISQHLFTLCEAALISSIYFIEFHAKGMRRFIIAFVCLFLILTTIVLARSGFYQESNVLTTFEAIGVIGFSWAFFYKVFHELKIPKLTNYYFFWLNSAFLIYFSMSFFLFLFDGYLERCPINIAYVLYSIHLITNIAFNILLSIGIWRIQQK